VYARVKVAKTRILRWMYDHTRKKNIESDDRCCCETYQRKDDEK